MHHKLLRQSNGNMSLQFSCCTTGFKIFKYGYRSSPPLQKALVSQSVGVQPYKPYLHTQVLLNFNTNSLHAWPKKKEGSYRTIYSILNSSVVKPETYATRKQFFFFLNYTINTCWASSLVGANTSAWVSLNSISNCCRMEIANVAVLPVPDWAWAITSYPKKSRIHIYRSHMKLSLLLHTMYSSWNMIMPK